MKSKRLPHAEFEIMNVIWDREPPVTTALVWEAIGKERGIKIQTILTLFARLEERGFLRFTRGKGRERDFFPVISRDEYLQMETESFISHYHKQSYASLLSALHSDKLTDQDLDELTQWINTARNDRKEREENG